MESDFLEISGEDDSLLPLPKFPNDDISSLNNTMFTCSPLHPPRSGRPIKPPLPTIPAGNEKSEKLDSLDHLEGRDDAEKENLSASKPEMAKLNIEPQQMKKKKKGGFNLRKSLAWNHAFFTEEGVLDPLELSMISGNDGKPNGSMLSIIDEDMEESLIGGSENLVALEENLFKEFHSSSANEDRKNSVVLSKNAKSAELNVVPTSAVKRKVSTSNETNKSDSKRSGIPRSVATSANPLPASNTDKSGMKHTGVVRRPVAPSSLKRPNLNTSKAVTKEQKVSKISVSKPGAPVVSSTTKRTIPVASSSKQSQISQRAVTAQRNIGLKNPGSSQTNSSSGMAIKPVSSKSSVRPAKRNVISSVPKINSSSNPRPPLDTKANNGLKTDITPKLPTSALVSDNSGSSCEFENMLSQQISCTAGNVPYAEPQKAKPSGLRMPSPSLGFFNQSKASATRLLQTSNQPCSVQSGDLGNSVALGPPLAVAGSLDIQKKMSSNLHTNAMQKKCSNLISGCHSSNALNQSKPDSCNDLGQHAEASKNQRIPLVGDTALKSNDDQLLPRTAPNDELLEDIDVLKRKISHVGESEVKNEDNKSLFQTASSDQPMRDPDSERVTNVYPVTADLGAVELKQPITTSQPSPTTQVIDVCKTRDKSDHDICMEDKICDSSTQNIVFSELLIPDTSGQLVEQPADEEKLYVCRDEHSLQINNDKFSEGNESLLEYREYNTMLTEDVSSNVNYCGINELEYSNAISQSKDSEETNEAGDDIFSTESELGRELQSIHEIPSVNNTPSSPVVDGQQRMMPVDDANQLVNNAGSSSPAVEGCSCDLAKTADFHGDEALLGSVDTELGCMVKLHDQTASEVAAPDCGTVQGCEMEISKDLTSQHITKEKLLNEDVAAMQVNGGSDLIEHIEVENIKCDISQNNMRSNQVGDREVKNEDIKSLFKTASNEQLMEDADSELVTNVYPITGDSGAVELEQPVTAALPCPTTQVIDGCKTMDIPDDDMCVDDKLSDSSIKNVVFSELPIPLTCWQHAEQPADKEKLSACHDDQSFQINSNKLSKEYESLREYREYSTMSTEDVSSNVKYCGISELEDSPAISQSKDSEETNEPGDDILSTGSEAVGEVQSVHEIPSVNNTPSSPVIDGQHMMPFDDANQLIVNAGSSSLAVEGCGCDVAKTADFHGDEVLLGAVDTEPSCEMKLHDQTASEVAVPDCGTVRGCEMEILKHLTSQHIDVEDIRCDISQNNMRSDQVGDREVKNEDNKSLFQTASYDQPMEDTDSERVTNVYPITENSGEVELEHPVPTSQPCPTMQVEDGSKTTDQPDDDTCMEDKLCDSSTKNGVFSKLLIPETSGQQVEQPADKENLHACHDDQSLQIGGDKLPEENESLPEHWQHCNMLTEDVSSDIKCHGTNELEECHASSQSKYLEETSKYEAGVDIFGTKAEVGGEVQSTYEMSSGNNTLSSPVVDGQQMMAVDDANQLIINIGSSSPAVEDCGCDESQHITIEHIDVEDRKCNIISQNSRRSSSDLQHDRQQSTSILHHDGSTSVQIVDILSEQGMELCRNMEIGNSTESPDVRNLSGGEAENCGFLFHHHHTMEQSNKEIAGADETIDESDKGDPQVQAVGKNLFVDGCKFNVSTVKTVSSDPPPDGLPEQSGFQTDSDLLSVQGSPDAHEFSLNEMFAGTNLSSEELQLSVASSNAMDDISSSVALTSVTAAAANDFTVEQPKHGSLFDEVSDSFDIQRPADCDANSQFEHVLELTDDQKSAAECNSEKDEAMINVQTIDTNAKSNECKADVPGEADTAVIENVGGSNSDSQHKLEDTPSAIEDINKTEPVKNSLNEHVIIPPPHAVPFSDEWLAALEAAGEEILTKKSGAVQNSPPEKTLPEPGPWSPVKRKHNQEIGPFDCTKHTNTHVNNPPSSTD